MTEPFVSINELSKRLNIPAHTLRYWEKQFPNAIRPTTGAGGRRYYREDVATAVEQIKNLLHEQGYTIAGVKKLIVSGGFVGARGNAPAVESGAFPRAPTPPKSNVRRGGTCSAPTMAEPSTTACAAEIDAAIEILRQARAALADTES